MKLLVKRIAKKSNYTIGKLYINGEWFCDTLEDTDRGLTQSMQLSEIRKVKVANETAIPAGTYTVTMAIVSPKFKNSSWARPYGGKLPRLLNVPGYEGVLIHVGNSAKDTAGCILVGKNKAVGKVLESQTVFKELMKKLQGQSITITIQ